MIMDTSDVSFSTRSTRKASGSLIAACGRSWTYTRAKTPLRDHQTAIGVIVTAISIEAILMMVVAVDLEALASRPVTSRSSPMAEAVAAVVETMIIRTE